VGRNRQGRLSRNQQAVHDLPIAVEKLL